MFSPNVDIHLNLPRHDLRVPVGSLSWFKLCLPVYRTCRIELHVGSFKRVSELVLTIFVY